MSSSPTSPRFVFRTTWHDQIRETGAVDRLKEGRYDLFPLQQTQTLTNNVLNNNILSNNILGNSFFNRGATPGTLDADILLVSKLAPFKNENFALEAGVLACFHAFSHNGARGQLREALRRCEVPGPFFLHQARAYLQLLILASGIRHDFVPDEVPAIAKALFNVVKEREPEEPFPAIIGSLEHVGKESLDDYFPLHLVEMILCHANYKEKLRIKLNELRTSCQWHSAYQLVAGARQLTYLPAKALLRYALPDRNWWMPWTPNPDRIREWETRLSEQDRYRLVLVLDLEGPDTRGQQRQLLRHSCCGIFSPAADALPLKNGRHIMDSLMTIVDRAVARGPEAIGLITTMCIKPRRVDWQNIERIEAALGLPSSDGIRALIAYVRGFEKGDLSQKVQACTTVLTTITTAPQLQNVFGSSRDLANSGCRVFLEATGYLCDQLYKRQASERFALATGRLGRALASAAWLHELWHDGFVEDLQGVPGDAYISNAFHIIRTASEDEYLMHRDDMASCLCLSKRADAAAADAARSPRLNDSLIRSIQLDHDRGLLRDKLCQEIRDGFSPDEAMACVNQSKKEHPIFVRRIRELITPENNDMLCVNLAAYLSRQHASLSNEKRPAECWRQLLMHKMRQRPAGLLERVGEALTTSKMWIDWQTHLRWLYQERHYDPEGGLGFTPEKFNAVTVRKMGIGRSVSMSTNSTGSSGGYAYLGRGFGRD
ncbi:hypothetical protein ACHAPT_006926 [Fusarium lateritium]